MVVLALSQSTKNKLVSVSAICGVLLSILNLSNATKNQKDAFSSFVQSYFTKAKCAIYYIFAAYNLCDDNMLKMAMGCFAVLLSINALIGLSLLYKLYGMGVKNSVVIENLVESTEEQAPSEKPHNSRIPAVLV